MSKCWNFVSEQIARKSGFSSFKIFNKELTKPKIADVCIPVDVVS